MSEIPQLPAEHRICDTCKWGHAEKGNIVCFGAPPTPILVAAAQGQFGGLQMQFENMRPTLKKGTPACRLYETSIRLLNG